MSWGSDHPQAFLETAVSQEMESKREMGVNFSHFFQGPKMGTVSLIPENRNRNFSVKQDGDWRCVPEPPDPWLPQPNPSLGYSQMLMEDGFSPDILQYRKLR